jgi:hypothetical protein
LQDLLAQRIYQTASGYADGNDANSLRRDPMFKLGVDRLPLEPEHDLASAPTLSRLEHSVDRTDLVWLKYSADSTLLIFVRLVVRCVDP